MICSGFKPTRLQHAKHPANCCTVCSPVCMVSYIFSPYSCGSLGGLVAHSVFEDSLHYRQIYSRHSLSISGMFHLTGLPRDVQWLGNIPVSIWFVLFNHPFLLMVEVLPPYWHTKSRTLQVQSTEPPWQTSILYFIYVMNLQFITL